MSVTITINGDNAQEAGAELQTLARLLSGTAITYRLEEHGGGTTQAPVAAKAKPTAKKAPAAEPVDEELSAEDIEMQRELNAPVEKAPAIASQVVDAGTGKPVGADTPGEEAKPMTAADVRAAAAKLAAKDTPALAALLKKYNAPSLSAVPPESLGDFAGDVLEALG